MAQWHDLSVEKPPPMTICYLADQTIMVLAVFEGTKDGQDYWYMLSPRRLPDAPTSPSAFVPPVYWYDVAVVPVMPKLLGLP